MFSSATIIVVIFLYIGLLFVIGLWGERKSTSGRDIGNHPLVYSLSLAIYCTSWTYYGSVGNAATSGLFFLTIYIGPTLMVMLWWTVLRKLVRIKSEQRITSIADFISARYGKSQSIAAIATVIALIGSLPYIALQLKAVISTFAIITSNGAFASEGDGSWIGSNVGSIVVVLMIIFTIVFGVRRLDPTERHQGMVVVVAAESLVKLVTFIAAGVFVTFFVFNGFEDIFHHGIAYTLPAEGVANPEAASPLNWAAYILLSMSAILFLPRQFHISVVENSDENHIRTAMWLFPLYMFLINIFVFPIAKGGLIAGLPIDHADTYVLQMPILYGKSWLALAVFIGGFSAATSMIMISSMTLSTMSTNHLLLPFIDWMHELSFLRRNLLMARWVAVALIILAAYWFDLVVGSVYSLVRLGIISFAAALQFAPVILGGIFWRRGNRKGAIMGLTSGFLVWIYTVIVPSFVRSGWPADGVLENGPWGVALLRPEQLFGLTGLAPLTHAVIWTMFFNIGFYIFGSLFFKENEEERRQAGNFVDVLSATERLPMEYQEASYIERAAKVKMLEDLLDQYFSGAEAREILNRCLIKTNVMDKEHISVIELADICNEVEKTLAGTIGAAAAYTGMKRKKIFTEPERRALQEAYGRILANFSLSPEDLKRKVDYYKEREKLLESHADELEDKLEELEEQVRQRRMSEEALRTSEERLQAIMDNSSAMMYLKDPEGRYILVNREFERLFGVYRDMVEGRIDHDILPAGVAEQFVLNDREALESKCLCQMEEAIAMPDGIRYYLAVKFPLLDDSGRVNGICGISTDITALKKAQDQLRRLSGSIMDNQEKERSALARELHDELGQVLTALRLDSSWLQGRLLSCDADAAKRAHSMCDLIDKTIEEVRSMSTRLRPGVLDDLGLMDALEWLVSDFEKRSDISCTIKYDDMPVIDEVYATAAYRITQEALTNILRHSKATEVDVLIEYNEGIMSLGIVDNGRGFNVESLEESEGFGVAGMRERASLVGGTLIISSMPGLGTRVFFNVPIELSNKDIQ